jgi:hypothetical protein
MTPSASPLVVMPWPDTAMPTGPAVIFRVARTVGFSGCSGPDAPRTFQPLAPTWRTFGPLHKLLNRVSELHSVQGSYRPATRYLRAPADRP